MAYLGILVLIILVMSGTYIFQQTEIPIPESTPSGNKGELVGQSEAGLDLSGRGLTKVPEYVFARTELEELDLSGNALEGALQAEVRHLQNLKVLDLSNNNFTGVPAEIGQLKDLEVLDLSNNKLTGLPYELGNLSKLKLLDISGNAYAKADLSIIRKGLPPSVVIKTE